MKKYIIEVSEEQMRLISNCLEDVSRFASGQWELRHTIEEMLKGLPFDEATERCTKAEDLLRQVKRVLLPELPDNGGKSYNDSDFIGNTYQIYRTMLYQLAKDNNWNNVYSSPALPSGNLGSIKVESYDGQDLLMLSESEIRKRVWEAFLTAEYQDENWHDSDTCNLIVKSLTTWK